MENLFIIKESIEDYCKVLDFFNIPYSIDKEGDIMIFAPENCYQ